MINPDPIVVKEKEKILYKDFKQIGVMHLRRDKRDTTVQAIFNALLHLAKDTIDVCYDEIHKDILIAQVLDMALSCQTKNNT